MVVTSHSGMLLTLLLLLGCSPLTMAVSLPTDPLPWPCGKSEWRCGNKCALIGGWCDCGGTTLRNGILKHYNLNPRYHCCTNTTCTESRGDVSCSGGQVRNITEPCGDGRCYGFSPLKDFLYPDYGSLDYFKSQYSCYGDLKDCLPIKHRCQGLSSCGDSQVCNEELRCKGEYGRL